MVYNKDLHIKMTLMISRFICIENFFSHLVSGFFLRSKGQEHLSIWQIWYEVTLFANPNSQNVKISCKVQGIYLRDMLEVFDASFGSI